MRWTWIACGALAVSLAGNLYLFASEREHSPSAPRATRPIYYPSTWREIPELVEPATKYEALDRVALEQRVADVEARIDKLRTPEEHFERGQPSPETEKVVRPYLDQVFDVAAGAERPYQIECRGGACKLSSERPMEQWMERLQSENEERLQFRIMFHMRETYLEPFDAELTASRFLWSSIVKAAAPSIATCRGTIQASGDLQIRLLLEPDGRVVQSASGSLVDHALAECIRRAFDAAIAKTPIPPEATSVLGPPLELKLP
jgi:hypothetical protein